MTTKTISSKPEATVELEVTVGNAADEMVNNTSAPQDDSLSIKHQLDTQGLICPEPIMMLHRTMRQAEGGDYIEVLATDPATTRDIPNFCRHLGHTLIDNTEAVNPNGNADNHTDKIYRYIIKKK